MNNIMEQIKIWWEERSFGQKFSLLFLTVALVAVLTYLFALGKQPDWEILADGLAPTDAAAVASHLKSAGIVYRISDGGKAILVPKEVVDQTRLEIHEADLITQDEEGLEGIGNLPIGLTETFQKLSRQKMLQGEIVRTIKKINGVQNARISIAEPERSIFTSQDDTPTASVMLVLDPGAKIKQEQIKAIKNLVSHSIPRLIPERVFVSDQYGNVLSEELANSGSSLDDLRSSYELKTERKVKEVLLSLVGRDNVSVAVTAEMNFDRTTAKIERYIPTSQNTDGTAAGVLISEQTSDEQYSGKDAKNPGGVPGTASNIADPGYAAADNENANKSSDYNKNSRVKNFEVSKEIKDIIYAPGEVERLTVAVAVNKVLTSEELEKIETLVRTASGADPARGDVITVTDMTFAGIKDIEKKEAALQKDLQMSYYLSIADKVAPYLLILLFGGITLGILWSLIRRPVEVEEMHEIEEPMFDFPEAPEILEAASIPIVEAKLDPEIERMRNEINSFVMNDPGEAARLLLSYIKD
jgi:flagellar M-ring protein FliF